MSKKLTLEEVKNYCLSVGSDFLSNKYETVDHRYVFKCIICNKEFTTTYTKFKQRKKHKCNECSVGIQWNIDSAREYIKSKNCELLSSEYKNNCSKLKIRCSCGNCFETTLQIFISNKKHHCKLCGLDIKRKKFAKTTKQFKIEIKELDDNFEVLGDYYNAKTKIKMLYKPKNKIIEITPSDFVNNGKRGYCYGSSNAEKIIELFLICNNISFKRQYEFKDLKYIKPLRFDFGITNNDDNSLKYLIEYDGENHYMPVKYSSSLKDDEILENYEKIKLRDNLKNEYCKKNNILLYRIPYWCLKDINKILKDIVLTL